jgi:ABC-type amino acid transport substrate-binding protein
MAVRRQLRWLALALAFALPPTTLRADPVLHVLINDVAPYTIHGEAQHTGMHAEIMAALAGQSDVPMDMQSVVYVRLLAAMRNGSADLVVGVESPELDGLAIRVGPLHSFRSVVISRKDASITSVAALKGKLLGIARGAFYDDSINNDTAIRKFDISDPFQGVMMLSRQHLDAVISSDYLLAYALRQPGIDSSQFAKPFTVNEKHYILYARKSVSAAVIEKLRATLVNLAQSGQIETILRDYQLVMPGS